MCIFLAFENYMILMILAIFDVFSVFFLKKTLTEPLILVIFIHLKKINSSSISTGPIGLHFGQICQKMWILGAFEKILILMIRAVSLIFGQFLRNMTTN